MSADWSILYDPATPILLILACGTILYGAFRSVTFYAEFKESLELEQSTVKMWTAIVMPIVGSIFLVLLFYFLEKIAWLLVGIFTLTSLVGMTFVSYSFVEKITIRFKIERTWEIRWVGPITVTGIISFLIALAFVIPWLLTKNFVLTDILALSLAITALSFVRLPNLKISVLILVLFFLYDIFWVFISEFIFTDNVMVSVATKLPQLPMVILIPRFLSENFALLGVGDIVLPGLFLCFLHRFDRMKRTTFRDGYFLRAWIGYFLGLILTLIMVVILQRGQPALLYLVPFTLIPIVLLGWRRKELKELWRGVVDHDVESGQYELADALLEEAEE